MSALIGALRVSLSMDTAAFERGADIAEKRISAFGKKMQTAAGRMASIGKTMSIAITAPLTAFGIASFKAASDAAELDSAFAQTFGKLAGSMDRWAEATGNAMSRSTREIKEGANAFGLYFNQAAKTRIEAAKMSQQFTVLAQDLASFNNTSVDDALVALRSGLSGETEPMRRFGVFLNEAAVKAKALEMGLTPLNGKLTDQQKIMARAAIILQATTNAQGDVIRTSAGAANQIRASKAAWEELQIVVGTKLLPMFTPLISKLAEVLNWFTQLPKPVQNVALTIAAVTAVTGPFLIGFGAIINAVSKSAPLITALVKAWTLLKAGLLAARVAAIATLPALIPFIVPIGLITAAVVAGYLAWKNWDKIKAIVANMVQGVVAWLKRLAAPFIWVIEKVRGVGDAFGRLYDRVVGHSYIPDMVSEIGTEMAKLDRVLVEPVTKATSKAGEAFRELQARASELLNRLFPEQSRHNQFVTDLALLEEYAKKAGWSVERLAEAIQRLRQEYNPSLFGTNQPSFMDEDISVASPVDYDALARVGDKLPQLVDWTKAWNEQLKATAAQGLQSLADGLTAVIMGTAKLGDVFRSVVAQMLADLIRFQIQKAIVMGIDGLFGTGSAAGMGLMLPGRASGGPVYAGHPYIVGERGPELFLPGKSGQIVPNHAMGGAPVTINVNAPMSDRDARRTGSQLYAGWASEQARARAKGIA